MRNNICFDGVLLVKSKNKNYEQKRKLRGRTLLKSKLHSFCAAGFAIGSPISPRHVNASDQVRVLLGHRLYVGQLYYSSNLTNAGHNSIAEWVTAGRNKLQDLSDYGLFPKGVAPLPGLKQNRMARVHFDLSSQPIDHIL